MIPIWCSRQGQSMHSLPCRRPRSFTPVLFNRPENMLPICVNVRDCMPWHLLAESQTSISLPAMKPKKIILHVFNTRVADTKAKSRERSGRKWVSGGVEKRQLEGQRKTTRLVILTRPNNCVGSPEPPLKLKFERSSAWQPL